ncbi:MAG TPA: ATPase P, partial [Ruminococcaceae bacterium]|nr:ATPase P [Oscillospiraceae bacterium]
TNRIIKFIGFSIIPIGILLFYKQIFISGQAFKSAVVTTVAALIGMIPEGLVLLTSVVFAVSVVRLALRKALVQELYSVETLARVDTLCLD